MRRIMALPPTTSDADAIVQRSRAVSGRLSRGVSGLLKKNKVQTIWGEARPTAPGCLSVAEPVGRSSRPRPDKPAGALGAGDYTADYRYRHGRPAATPAWPGAA